MSDVLARFESKRVQAQPMGEPGRSLFIVETGGKVRSVPIGGANQEFYHNPPWANSTGEIKGLDKVHSWTYACLKRRGDAFSSVDIQVMTGTRRDKRAVENHELQAFFDSPNPFLSRTSFLVMWQRSLDISGRAMAIFDPFEDQDYRPDQIPSQAWPQDPAAYEAVDATGKPVSPADVTMGKFEFWRSRINRTLKFPKHQVVYYESPSGSPLSAARLAAEGDYLAAEYNRRFIDNDCRPSGWVEIERKLTQDQRTQVRESLESQNSGTANAGPHGDLRGDEVHAEPVISRGHAVA